MTDSIFALEGCRTQIAWVDLKRQLQNMIISYSGDAVQRGLGCIAHQVFVNWSLPAEAILAQAILAQAISVQVVVARARRQVVKVFAPR